MNIVKRLTLRHMGVNKGRTVVTVCGIAVSVAMITAVFVSLSSFLNLYVNLDMDDSGRYNADCENVTEKQISDLKNDERVGAVGAQYLPVDNEYFVKSGSNMKSMKIGDSEYMNMFITCNYDGEIPKNDGEIAVEEKFIKQNKPDWNIGRIVTFDIEKEAKQSGNDESKSETQSEKVKTVTGKITAILHDNSATDFAAVVMHRSAPEKGETVNSYFTLKNVDFRFRSIKELVVE